MMSTTITDVTRISPPTPPAILDHDPHALRELLAPLGGTIVLSDLDRIRTPAAGATVFSVPTPAGEQPRSTLTGVIVHVQPRRAYWSQEYSGAGVAPDCSSPDGVTGVGDPGGACAGCPLALFGVDGEAQGCRETWEMVLFLQGDVLPTIFVVSRGGIRSAKSYLVSLVKRGLKSSDLTTTIGLERTKSRAGMTFSKPTFSMVGMLDVAQRKRMREIVVAFGFGAPVPAPGPSKTPDPSVAREPGPDDVPEYATMDLTSDDDVPPGPVDEDIPF